MQFAGRDFSTVRSKVGDFLSLDPPYKFGKFRLDWGRFDHAQLFDWMRNRKGRYAMSLNGFIGEEDRRVEVPQHLFDKELLININNGVSTLRQLNGMTPPRLRDSLSLRLR